MKKSLQNKINELGFAEFPQIIDETEIEKLIECLTKLKNSSAVREKSGATYGIRNLLNLIPEIQDLAESKQVKNLIEKILGKKAKPVRAIFFDKTPETNWKVPPHQDLTIAVKEKRETAGFRAWTIKAGICHVQPPIEILENILTVRIHLDDADEANGTLKVIPKSHKNGRLSSAEIAELSKANETQVRRIKRGEVFLMRPLLVHSSSAGTNPTHRRVIHIEYSAENLPNGLKWYGS